MAKRVVTALIDDLDGGQAERTVEFGLDGMTYSIDLSDENAGKLRTVLDPYLAVASRLGRAPRGGTAQPAPARPARSNREQNQLIREWALANGYEVSDRGRIASSVVEAYRAAH